MWNVRTPALVVALALSALASCGDGTDSPDHKPCPYGCEVPTPGEVTDPVALSTCEETAQKGPCTSVARGSDGVDHWWYVDTGHTLYDGTARDLGVVDG